MRARGVDKLFSALLKDLFSIEARTVIEVAGSEQKRLARIRAQRLAEEARIAEETARGVREDTGKKKSAQQEAAYGRVIHDDATPMNEITEDIGRMTVMGEVAALEMRDTKNGQSKIVTFSMTDHKGSVNCKLFLGGRRQSEDGSVEEQAEKLRAALKDGLWVKARGNYRYDDYKREMVLMVSDVMSVPKPVREDNAPRKRVELHLHTQMSTMDACASAKALISQAAAWGIPPSPSPTTAWCRPFRRPSARCAARTSSSSPAARAISSRTPRRSSQAATAAPSKTQLSSSSI